MIVYVTYWKNLGKIISGLTFSGAFAARPGRPRPSRPGPAPSAIFMPTDFRSCHRACAVGREIFPGGFGPRGPGHKDANRPLARRLAGPLRGGKGTRARYLGIAALSPPTHGPTHGAEPSGPAARDAP